VLVAHAQLQDEGRVLLELPLRALYETAMALSGPGGPEVGVWAAVAERLRHLGPAGQRALEEHLWLVAELFGTPSPTEVGAAARRHGRLVLAVADHPRARAVLGQLAFLPRSFRAERMVALHGGSSSGLGLWWTRARHAAVGAVSRAGTRASARRRWRPGSPSRRR